ncbi:MAG: galactose mutarotase [Bacilli bacterium]|nr:galactose mutarotase [Bacilli bacterium]
MKKVNLLSVLLVVLSLSACKNEEIYGPNHDEPINESGNNSGGENNNENEENNEPEPEPEREVVDMQLSNLNGMLVKFDRKGAKISSVRLNDLKIAENGFVAGRVANRIANASFQLDGVTYNVNRNNGQHCLHGGAQGFGEINWTKTSQTYNTIVFELDSRDGDQGFPGNIHVSTTYTLSDEGELSIEYRARSDKKTLFAPTNHLYMNMNGVETNTWRNHSLWVNADTYTKAKSDLIPTGEIVSASGTKLDYFEKKSYEGNNDSNLVLKGDGFRKVAEMTGDSTHNTVEVFTDMPGLQVYNDTGHICLETQFFPDAIHQENFPSIVLDANTDFYSKTSYKFSTIS